ncbi:hypothetical protein PBI_BEAGLE_115 [Arthrobacter phage Beagle]|nr:hypothetical protein PBI_BEAGLE_115 [Arthrobacter phage Beagle]
MEIVIMEWLLWAYPLIGSASIYPFARYHRLDNPNDSVTYTAFMGLTYSVVWPVMAMVAGVGYSLKREQLRETSRKKEQMTLETAYDVIARHEAKLREDRRVRNERLRRDWVRLSGLEVGLDKPAPPELDPWRARWQRSTINSIWDSVRAAEEDAYRAQRAKGYVKRKL